VLRQKNQIVDQFSEQLVERLTRYFEARFGITLSRSEASDYLRQYADAFLAFAPKAGRAAARAHSAAADPASTDLINSTLNENEIN